MSLTIDIGDRMTGKTTRLIDEVINRLTRNEKSIIITCNRGMVEYIENEIYRQISQRRLVPSWIRTFKTDHIKCYSYRSVDNNIRGINMEDTRLFYDEFDHYLDDLESWVFSADGYYCTTPFISLSNSMCLSKLTCRLGGI